MSFKSKILMFISLILLISLAGTFLLSISNTQAFLEKQLKSHSDDTATSLGLSLSSVADLDDPASMQTMIDAVFDRGHFAVIGVTDIDGKLIYERTNKEMNGAIPAWFIQSVDIEIPPASAVVQSGWMPIGTLKVQAHKGYAYIELWKTFKQISWWFVLTATTFLIVAHVAVKFLLKPLQRVTEQAQAIVNKKYIIQSDLPNTTEFRHLVLGMNDMVTKLEEVFSREAQVAEKLRTMAYQDSVTGLSNRHYFDMIFNSLLDEHEQSAEGSMCLLKINGLKTFNDRFGYQLGNDLVRFIAGHLQQTFTGADNIYVRMNGVELLAILPGQSSNQIAASAEQLTLLSKTVLQHFNINEPTLPITLAVAIVPYSPGLSRSTVLTQLNFTIQQAESAASGFAIQRNRENEIPSLDKWKEILQQAVAKKRFQLYQQSSFDNNSSVYDSELLIRMINDNGSLQSAAYFMPAVEQLNMQIDIDHLVLDMVLAHLTQSHVNASTTFAVNLSRALLVQPEQLAQLDGILVEAKGLPLAFEFAEQATAKNTEHSQIIFNALKRYGFTTGIDRFGAKAANLHCLKEVQPAYIKLDGAFSERIESDEQTRSYVASIAEMAASLDIDVIATSVETEAQKQAFLDIGISYFQGYLFATPMPLTIVNSGTTNE